MATVVRESIGNLTDKLTVKLTKEDYLPAFEKKLKEYGKTANIPGFRKGHVPAGMIKKMYGAGIFSDEVLRTVEKELYTWLDKERPDIFAQPLPAEGELQKLSMENPGDFDFAFEIGLKPEFTVADLSKAKLKRYEVDVTDEMVNNEIERLRKAAPAQLQPAEAQENTGEPAAEPVLTELNEEFFNSLLPGKEIKTEDDFRAAMKEEMKKYWAAQSRNQLHDQLYHYLLDESKIDFPQAFLTRWLRTGGDKQRSAEEAENEYPGFQNQLKWTLVSDRMVEDNKITVPDEEIRSVMQQELMQYFGQMPAGSDMSWLDAYLDRMMKDEKQVDRTFRRLLMEKVFAAAEAQVSPVQETISAEAFTALQHNHSH